MLRLNEGHTVYLERMIGRCLEGEQFRQFKALGGWKDLQESVSFRSTNTAGASDAASSLPPSPPLPSFSLLLPLLSLSPPSLPPQVNTFGANNPLTNLVPSLQDVDPDEAFSSVPYEKGFALLYHLEELLGGPGETWPHPPPASLTC